MHRHITEAVRREFCLLGAENGGPRKFLNFESLKCHFLDFGEVLTECGWSEKSVLVCRNLQFAYNL